MHRFFPTRRARRLFGLGATGVVAAVILAGCSVSGGGWMYSSLGPPSKATFGFDVTCDENTHTVTSGSWTYHDKAAGVDVSGSIAVGSFCPGGGQGGEISFPSDYVAQHCKVDCTGGAGIDIFDSGTNGKPLKGDILSIELFGGVYDGYSNSGTVQGGNLTVS